MNLLLAGTLTFFVIHTILWLIRSRYDQIKKRLQRSSTMSDLEQAAEASREHSSPKGRFFMRFTRAQRYLHATLFTTFLGLAATGLPCASARASGRAASPARWADSAPSSSFTSFAPWC